MGWLAQGELTTDNQVTGNWGPGGKRDAMWGSTLWVR